MSAAALVGVALVVAVAGAVQLAAGFGFGLAAVPLLSVVLDPHDAVIVALGLATFTNSYQASPGATTPTAASPGGCSLGAAVGLPIGLLVFLRADDRWLGIVIGVAVLVAVAVIAKGIDLRHAGPGLDVAGGALSGALTMSAGVNGPPLVFVLQARHFDQRRFRAHDHDDLRRPRRRQHRRLRRAGRDRPGHRPRHRRRPAGPRRSARRPASPCAATSTPAASGASCSPC